MITVGSTMSLYSMLLQSRQVRPNDVQKRQSVKQSSLKNCEYMSNHIGECFEGVISGVTEWGFFVELPNTVEGLVRVTDLTDDFYEFYEDTYELAGFSHQ